jgi:hypothetical protein
MKQARQGHKFEEREQLLVGIYDFSKEVQLFELMSIFHLWIEGMRWAMKYNGDYYHEYSLLISELLALAKPARLAPLLIDPYIFMHFQPTPVSLSIQSMHPSTGY